MSRAPIIGHHYTMSAMKHSSGDRSWIGHIWLVIEGNGRSVIIRDPFAKHAHSFGRAPMVVDVSEFDWTPADEMAEAMRSGVGEAA